MTDQPTSSVSQPVEPPIPSEPIASDIPATAEFTQSLPDLSNLYFFGDAQAERDRLMAQTFLFSEYIRQNAFRLIHNDVSSILDIGCGQGQLTLVLSKLYPKARIVGIDSDANVIAAAQVDQRNAPMVSGKIEFVVGDIQDKLPDGPFDLIFASAILLHLYQPEKVLQMAFKALRPGGSIWIKEMSSSALSFDHPLWPRILELTIAAFNKIGRDYTIGPKVEGMLNKVGFTEVSIVPEVYRMSNRTTKERIAMSNMLAAVYNGGVVIYKVLDFPHEEFLVMHRELCANTETLTGSFSLINLIARRPVETQAEQLSDTPTVMPLPAPVAPTAISPAVETSQAIPDPVPQPVATTSASTADSIVPDPPPAQTTAQSQPETLSITPPDLTPVIIESAATTSTPAAPPSAEPASDSFPAETPDFSEEYLFNDTGSDRDRLIAQAFLLSEYIRQNATRLVRNDVRTILDMGCGEGQLTLTLSKVYPRARIIGMDQDVKGLEVARENQKKMPLASHNVEFIAGDITKELPDGPFDLIFTSLVMLHQAQPEKILQSAYNILSPNGTLWIKDLYDWAKNFDHPAWAKYAELASAAFRKVHLDPDIGFHLEALVQQAGFVNIQVAMEAYKINNVTWQGRIAMSNMLAVIHNSRQFISRLQGIPEDDILALYKELSGQTETLKGNWRLINLLGRRPAKSEVQPAKDSVSAALQPDVPAPAEAIDNASAPLPKTPPEVNPEQAATASQA